MGFMKTIRIPLTKMALAAVQQPWNLIQVKSHPIIEGYVAVITSFCGHFTYIWEHYESCEMKHKMTLFHTMGPNGNALFQTHLLFMTIYGSLNIRLLSCTPMCHWLHDITLSSNELSRMQVSISLLAFVDIYFVVIIIVTQIVVVVVNRALNDRSVASNQEV